MATLQHLLPRPRLDQLRQGIGGEEEVDGHCSLFIEFEKLTVVALN